jgi:RNA polymerase sigma factor (sigma-70 family)
VSEDFPRTETGYTDQLRDGRNSAWGRLLTEYGPGIRDVFRRAGVRADDLEDQVMNAVCLIPAKVAKTKEKIQKFGAWLKRVLWNMANDYHEEHARHARERPQGGDDAQELLASIPEFEPTDELEKLGRDEALLERLLQDLRKRLTEKQFQVLSLILEGHKQREIAALVGLDESTVSILIKDKIYPRVKEAVIKLLEDT